jgi:hypothetical protein
MSFRGNIYKFNRLQHEHAAWSLLRANNSSMIIAFLVDLFADESEVPYEQARVALEANLTMARDTGLWETDTSAPTYLNQWVQAGWMRDRRGEETTLAKTDAAEVAIRFAQGLEGRTAGASASRLMIFQDAVRNTAIDLNPSPEARIIHLEAQMGALKRQIDDLRSGHVNHLSEDEQFQRLMAIYDLGNQLTGDFSLVEDNIRRIDQQIRTSMYDSDQNRGDTLSLLLEKESILAMSAPGQAFDGFYQLLRDDTRSGELRERLREILTRHVAERLTSKQRRFLAKLVDILAAESDRVITHRRRTEESLRVYIESNTAKERKVVDDLLKHLAKQALHLKELGVSPKTPTRLSLPSGSLKVHSPASIRLYDPEDAIILDSFEENTPSSTLSNSALAMLDAVDVHAVAHEVHDILVEQGPMTISQLISRRPIESGHEELIAHIRVARAVHATMPDGEYDRVEFVDRDGSRIRATIPTLILSADLFPEDIDALAM